MSDNLKWQPISELHEDHGMVIALKFTKDQGVILGEPPECGLICENDSDFNPDDWDVFAEIDWNPAFELAELEDLKIINSKRLLSDE